MAFFVIGINHKTAPIAIREKFYCNATQKELLLSELKNHPSLVEGFVLSTCNRTEVYVQSLTAETAKDFLLESLFRVKNVKTDGSLLEHFYWYKDEEAIKHLMKVTCGLDSLILGEEQILGQVKEATGLARQKGMLGKYLNILSNIVIHTAKKAHTETQISLGGVSISWAAVTMAEETLGSLRGKSLLVIGAGKMGELAINQLHNKGLARLYLMNRTGEKAVALAEKYHGIAVSFFDIKDILNDVDVCICSAGAPHYVLDKDMVTTSMALRRNRKILFIDISVPRNIDPAIAEVQDVLLFHVDDLERVVGDNMKKREAAALIVDKIIEEKVKHFHKKIAKLNSISPEDSYETASS